jgi:hypothetical protein
MHSASGSRTESLSRRSFLLGSLALAVAPAWHTTAIGSPRYPVKLNGTTWQSVADEHGLDPWLLYAVAIVETKKARRGRVITPWPWALRSPQGAWYGRNQNELVTELEQALRNYSHRLIDVGLMQINVGWHSHRVERVTDLSDPNTNLRVAAVLLHEAIDSSPTDPLLGIGRYHSWRPDHARRYGAEVMRVYHQIYDYKEVFEEGAT